MRKIFYDQFRSRFFYSFIQLKKSVVYCKKIHIRYKTKEISLHAIKRFFESTIEPKLDNMRKVTPDVVLLRNSLNNLKSNLMGILNKHNEIMLSHAEISYQQQQLENLVGALRCNFLKLNIQQNPSEIRLREILFWNQNPINYSFISDSIKRDWITLIAKYPY